MTIFKKISLAIGVVCLAISAGAIINFYYNNESEVVANSNDVIKNDSFVNSSTRIILNTKYLLCNHENKSEIQISDNMLGLSKDELIKFFNQYNYVNYTNNVLLFENQENKYCNEHYLIKEDNNSIKIYLVNDGVSLIEKQTLQLNINELRQNDRYIFKNTGLRIDGKENLYKFLEDYEIYYEI